MSEYRVRFMTAARTELRQAVTHYDTQVLGLGDELSGEVARTLGIIQSHPESGGPYLSNTRRALVRRFPFSLVYRLRLEEIVIVAVAHQRRKPGYWKVRL